MIAVNKFLIILFVTVFVFVMSGIVMAEEGFEEEINTDTAGSAGVHIYTEDIDKTLDLDVNNQEWEDIIVESESGAKSGPLNLWGNLKGVKVKFEVYVDEGDGIFKYSLLDSDNEVIEGITFHADEYGILDDMDQRLNNYGIKISVLDDYEDDWYKLEAGTYTEIIQITISNI